MTRAYNFCAGPAALPQAVLEQARDEMLNWGGRGLSVMEMSHRGDDYQSIAIAAEQDLRELLQVPANYKILFMQGGASSQFSMIPLNLFRGNPEEYEADYIVTGQWSKKAAQEAARYGKVNIAASTEATNFASAPTQAELNLSPSSQYVHYCANETIGGVAFDYIPDVGDKILVADYSSSILSEPLDVSRFGMIYAGAQKNIGPAGLCIVIIREDLLGHAQPLCPTMMDYKVCADADSMYNTPATYSWYLAGLVFQWLKQLGGLDAMKTINDRKAAALYDYIDHSGFYANPVAKSNRSKMNVPFTLADSRLDELFLRESEAAGLLYLAGHRSVGGMRASIYNAVPEEGVAALICFMQEFAAKHA